MKTLKRMTAAFTAIIFTLSLCSCGDSALAGDESVTELSSSNERYYANTLFDTSYVHEINVEISDSDWAELLANPTDKTKYSVTVTIDGTTLEEVAFSVKGNTSLSEIASTDSDRYSFKLNFGKYVDGQTYDGLDKLSLNNCYSDATYLKDYLSYRIMAEAGAAASLVSFVSLSINGEVYGLYLAIEQVDESFLERNYGEDYGELYKPESESLAAGGGGGMGFGDFDFDNMEMPNTRPDGDFAGGEMRDFSDVGGFSEEPQDIETQVPDESVSEIDDMPEAGAHGDFSPDMSMQSENGESFSFGDFSFEDFDFEGFSPDDMNFDFGDFGGFGSSSGGASLVYTDDEIESYSDIFDNVKTDADEEDYQRVIAALKQLSTGEDLESCVDVEAVMRYFAAHNFVVSFDSYTGSMLHNYYLYEKDGVLIMLPWDYNLAFGGFSSSSASEAVNYPIDTPLSNGVSEENRPMWSQLAANDEYMEMYHSYLDELLTNYFESGRFEEEFDAIVEMIRPYVESDPTAFYTVDEFDTATANLKEFCLLRAESIRGQLDGTIPSTSEGQSADSSALIDVGDMNLDDMGSMMVGGMGGFDMDRDMDFGMGDRGKMGFGDMNSDFGDFVSENSPQGDFGGEMQGNEGDFSPDEAIVGGTPPDGFTGEEPQGET